jgi:hypothetical protein
MALGGYLVSCVISVYVHMYILSGRLLDPDLQSLGFRNEILPARSTARLRVAYKH